MADDAPAAPPWVFQQPAEIVQEQINAMSDRADSSLATANAIISELASFEIGGENSSPPDFSFPAVPPSTITDPTKPSVIDLGTVDAWVEPSAITPNASLLQQLQTILNSLPTTESWQNPIPTLNIPQPPGPIDTSGMPSRPDLVQVTIPAAPQFQNPSMGALLDISIPAMPDFEFPTFTDEEVSFQGTPVNTVLNWAEPTYTPLLLNPLAATIQAMLNGDFIMPAVVASMLFDRDRSQEDDVALKAEQEAFTTWASRGFKMPPGMLVEQVNVAQQQNQLAANQRARDILTKSADWEIENLRQAIAQGIALESKLIDKFLAMAQRVFDAAKARLDADVAMFTQMVALFNAQQAARQVNVAIFNALLSEVTTRLEAWKTALQGAQIEAGINETTARIFQTQVQAVSLIVEQYKALMQGAQIQSDINKNLIDGYKADVEAYGQLLQARKVVYEAYEAEMRGVEAEGRVVEASARAFQATVEAQTAGANVKVQVVRGMIDVLNSDVQRYTAQANAERDAIAAQASGIDAKARAYSADISRYSAELQRSTEETRLSVTVAESELRSRLAYYETRVREYDQSMSRMIERGRVIVQALSSAGGMASQLASGAMAAMHVQASLSGSGNAGTQWSSSTSTSYNHNFEDE